MTAPLVLLDCVGLTPRLLRHAPRLAAATAWVADVREALPAVTCTAQATILTGELPSRHGIVGNGWLFRDTNEVRFWQQSNRLIQAEPFYATAKRRAKERGREFRAAKLFWWFNQGADVALSATPKPWYGVDGNKVFGITGDPSGFAESLETQIGRFPFQTFWGPMAGLPCTQWIARATALALEEPPSLTLAYLPHLDYEPQRRGPSGCDMAKHVRELDDACAPILDAAKAAGAQVWLVGEYGHCDVDEPVYLNRMLRELNLLRVRPGPFGEQIDMYASRVVAVCDHQLAHVYVRDPADVPHVADVLGGLPGVANAYAGPAREAVGLHHERSGEIVLLSKPNAWFAYPFWLDDAEAPDYARCVAIHHKPGYDPCELFFDPRLRVPKMHAARRVLQKKLGFRMKMDVVPLDAKIVRGSHGLAASDPLDRPLFAGHGPSPGASIAMTAIRDAILGALGLPE